MLKEGKFTAPVCEWGTWHAPHCSHGNMCACTVMWGPYHKSSGAYSCTWIIFHSTSSPTCWNISETNPRFCNNRCNNAWLSSYFSCVFCLKCLESHDHLHKNNTFFLVFSFVQAYLASRRWDDLRALVFALPWDQNHSSLSCMCRHISRKQALTEGHKNSEPSLAQMEIRRRTCVTRYWCVSSGYSWMCSSLFHKEQHVLVLPHSLTFYGRLSKIISSWPQLRQDTPWLM